jgi:transposase-like protein
VKEVCRRRSVDKEILRAWRELLAEEQNRLIIIMKADYE